MAEQKDQLIDVPFARILRKIQFRKKAVIDGTENERKEIIIHFVSSTLKHRRAIKQQGKHKTCLHCCNKKEPLRSFYCAAIVKWTITQSSEG